MRLEGLQGTTPVIFDEPGEPILLGAVTLEAFLLGVDPIARRLIPVEGLRVSASTPNSGTVSTFNRRTRRALAGQPTPRRCQNAAISRVVDFK